MRWGGWLLGLLLLGRAEGLPRELTRSGPGWELREAGVRIGTEVEPGPPVSCGTGRIPLRYDLKFLRGDRELWHRSYFNLCPDRFWLLENGDVLVLLGYHRPSLLVCVGSDGRERWRREFSEVTEVWAGDQLWLGSRVRIHHLNWNSGLDQPFLIGDCPQRISLQSRLCEACFHRESPPRSWLKGSSALVLGWRARLGDRMALRELESKPDAAPGLAVLGRVAAVREAVREEKPGWDLAAELLGPDRDPGSFTELSETHRVNLGLSLEMWQRWCGELSDPERAAMLEEVGDFRSVLFRARAGTVPEGALRRLGRVRAVLPLARACLSVQGDCLVEAGAGDPPYRSGPGELFSGRSLAPPGEKGLCSDLGQYRLVLDDHRLWSHHLASGKRVLCEGVDAQTVWGVHFSQREAVAAFQSEHQARVLDLETGQTLAHWPRPATVIGLNPRASEVILRQPRECERRDYRTGQLLQTYPVRVVDFWQLNWDEEGGVSFLDRYEFSHYAADGTRLEVRPRSWLEQGDETVISPNHQVVACRRGSNHLEFSGMAWMDGRTVVTPWQGHFSISDDGKRLCRSDEVGTRIWELDPKGIEAGVPPDLLVELWTGYRLQGDLPTEMGPREYEARMREWRRRTGHSW